MATAPHLIFGTGPVGKSIMQALIAQGESVTMINRSGTLNHQPKGVTLIAGDASQPDFTRTVSQGARYIYNATNPAYTEWAEKFPPLNNAILAGAQSAQAKLIVMDNLYMYGDTNGAPLTEDLPSRATGKKGKTRADMAKTLLDAHQKGNVQVVLGRASDFFGAGVHDSSLGDIVFKNALAGKTVNLLGNPDQPHTYTYMADIGRSLVTLAQSEDSYGRAWHLPSPKTTTTRYILSLIEQHLGKKITVQPAGRFMVTALGLFMPMMREFKETLYQFEKPFIMDDTAYKTRFGDTSTPLETAIEATFRWFQSGN